MIETHAHIYSDDYAQDRDAMLDRAWNAGIEQIWMPNCDHATIPGMMELAERFPGKCLPMIGLHPTYVKDDFETELTIIEEWLEKASFIAIGEIGMDLFWDKTFREQQEKAFLYQCKLARKHKLWIDIHSRSAFWETVKLIEEFGDPNLKGIFHCFTGTLDEANKAIELGFKLGIGGVATFKNGGLDKVIPFVDIEHLVLETDAPYLAPVPYRGKRNEVAYIDLVAQRVADLKQITKQEAIIATSENARKMLVKAS
ncbi:TatD family hydrolase [Dyadobacter chenhuakuii]|uniref:TatD family hydrolase n=1 Tax=Dyadobacter chenhuakuii TaxID=2909339 RepID=A0ABY4XMH6_9BACT|nr:TatD family hydrolase [Dyadobacter chenhuakuii]MCF2495060.1 TatD family hydrolase [Dyadobacter chenhuakuii]USJ31627.1 TatD family hydrolase [Dyadobacter chenhuakuii]